MKLKIKTDEYASSPRKDENLGSFTCFPHRKYTHGDDQSLCEEELSALQKKAKKGEIILLPVYMYDYSGCPSYSTSPFSCKCDSGMIGVIYVTRKKALEFWGASRMTKAVREKVSSTLKEEIEMYTIWAGGGVLQYSLEREGEEESWGGFYSLDDIFQEVEFLLKVDKKQEELFSTSLPLEVVIEGGERFFREISIPGLV